MKQKFITTAEAAKKWEVSQSDVLKACREGYISEALKNEKGVWQFLQMLKIYLVILNHPK